MTSPVSLDGFYESMGVRFNPPVAHCRFWAIPHTEAFQEIGTLRVYANGDAHVTPFRDVVVPNQEAALRSAAGHLLYGPTATMYGTFTETRDRRGHLIHTETVISVPLGRR